MKKNKREIYTVDKPCELMTFLLENHKGAARKDVKALLSHRSIVVDGKVRTRFDYKLRSGQCVEIDKQNRHEFLRIHHISLIYEDERMLVINKPEGLLSVASDDKSKTSAYEIMTEYVRKSDRGSRIFIVHRLDMGTSGVLLFSKSEEYKQKLQDDWNNLVTERKYCAVVEGVLEKKSAKIISNLKKNKAGMVYSTHNNGEKAITHYTVVSENNKYSLLNIFIETGKQNQIRVCCKDLGHPVAGDKKYGAATNPLTRLALHASRLVLTDPDTGQPMVFEAKIPSTFGRLVEK